MNLTQKLAKYKIQFPEAQDPLDYIATFGFGKIERIVEEAIDKKQEITFSEENKKITYNFKTK